MHIKKNWIIADFLLFHFLIVDIILFDAMGVFDRETASYTLGLVSVVIWVVAEIPQIITNYRAKSTDGLSATFLITWIIG